MLSSNAMGGGLKRPPLATILLRVKLYAVRRWHLRPGVVAQTTVQRQTVVYTLREHFEVPVPQIASLLGVTCRTVYRDYDTMKFIVKRSRSDKEEIENLRDYILYIYKYLR